MITKEKHQENLDKLAKLTVAQAAELERIERDAVADFRGIFDDLEKAIGMLRIGHHLGWKVLVLIHNKRTIKKYEKILNIKIRDIFPEEGPSADRSIGYKVAQKLGNFWKAVSGDIKIEQRRDIDE
jgi:predicted regulator of amino acid metabolism with ACT domain